MRILFVSHFYKPYLGGVERVVERLSQEFIRCGHTVSVVTTKYSFPREFHKAWSDVEVIDGVKVFRKIALVREVEPDLIIYMGDRWFWGNFVVRFMYPRACHIWCPVFHDLTIKRQWQRLVDGLFGKLVCKVVVSTNLEANKIQKAYGVCQSRVKVVPWGTSPISNAMGNRGDKGDRGFIRILAVGRLSRHKGQLWLAERFLEVVKKATVPCQLVLVGEVEDETADQISKLSINQTIIDTKADDDKLQKYYQTSDIFALFPEYESFGLAFLEAMSFGLPVLTHQVGALPEVLKEGAVLVEPYDKLSAEEELLRLISDADFRKCLGQQGQRFVATNFSWSKCAYEIISCRSNL